MVGGPPEYSHTQGNIQEDACNLTRRAGNGAKIAHRGLRLGCISFGRGVGQGATLARRRSQGASAVVRARLGGAPGLLSKAGAGPRRCLLRTLDPKHPLPSIQTPTSPTAPQDPFSLDPSGTL